MGLGRCPPPPKAECGLTMLYTSITDHPRDLGAQGALPLGPLDGASRSRTRRDLEGRLGCVRCSLSGMSPDRRLEVPVWMFDRAACQCWHVGVTPVASVTALRALAALLHDAAGVRDGASQMPGSSAASSSQQAIPGDADATPTSTTTARVVHPPQRRRSGPGAGPRGPHRPARIVKRGFRHYYYY